MVAPESASHSDAGPDTSADGGPALPNIPLLDDEIDREIDRETDREREAERGTERPALEQKPTWRGWIHAGTFPVTIVLGIVLISVAQGAAAKWASAVFVLTSMLLFGNSALYHRIDWKPKTKLLFKRIDHANIFLLIAGTYTPIAVLALPPEQGTILLIVVWAGALLGIGFRVFWIGAPRWLYVILYLALGWAAVAYLGAIFAVNPATMVLVAGGGLAYTLGAVAYALKRPNFFPGRFGFHEVFHTLTVVAFLCHWTAILLLVVDPPFNG